MASKKVYLRRNDAYLHEKLSDERTACKKSVAKPRILW